MAQDAKACPIAAYSVFARGKSSHQSPAGLLNPLGDISRCPWSHIAVDFVTGLSPLDGNNTIFTVVDHFSKAAHFIPLTRLPSAAEIVDLLVQQVICLPKDIVSD